MDYLKLLSKVFELAQVVVGWRTSMRAMTREERNRVAAYCETIASTLSDTGEALLTLADPERSRKSRDKAVRDARRSIGRLKGHIEDIAALLDGHLDGRKIAGVKRRLEGIVEQQMADVRLFETLNPAQVAGFQRRIGQLADAEGYFRSLSDTLKV